MARKSLKFVVLENGLPNDKSLDMTKLQVFADDKSNFVGMMISLFDRVENTVGKGENVGYLHFLLFPQCFLNPSSLGLLKVGIVCKPFPKQALVFTYESFENTLGKGEIACD